MTHPGSKLLRRDPNKHDVWGMSNSSKTVGIFERNAAMRGDTATKAPIFAKKNSPETKNDISPKNRSSGQ